MGTVDRASTTGAQEQTGSLRIQVSRDPNAGITLKEAVAAADFANAIGISTAYLSPAWQSGSPHGYDVRDYNAINDGIGGDEGFKRFTDALHARAMSLMVDIVPNHMSADEHNRWWEDVLEWGQESPYEKWFGIDWSKHRGRILQPFLGDHLSNVVYDPIPGHEFGINEDRTALTHDDIRVPLARAVDADATPEQLYKQSEETHYRLRLHFDQETGKFLMKYYDHYLPLTPATWLDLFEATSPEDGGDPVLDDLIAEMKFIGDPDNSSADRRKHAEKLQGTITHRYSHDAAFQERIVGMLAFFHSEAGRHPLMNVLQKQHYLPSYWKKGNKNINYRRFFNINGLVGLDQRLDEVFKETHRFVFEQMRQGRINALRVDHPDGLADPQGYLDNVRRKLTEILPEETHGDMADRVRVVVEKILSDGEKLRDSWPVQGTTGYDYLIQANALYVNRKAEGPIDTFYRQWTNDGDYHALELQAKDMVMREKLHSEISYLGEHAAEISEMLGYDFEETLLTNAVACIFKNMSVYRAYSTDDGPAPQDAEIIEAACDKAAQDPQAEKEVVQFIRSLLLRNEDLENRLAGNHKHQIDPALPGAFRAEQANGKPDEQAAARQLLDEKINHFNRRANQASGPVMAKSVEDTAFYWYSRLISLNEVGGNPGVFGADIADFHAHNAHIQSHWPETMTTTQTHDTKLGPLTRLLISGVTNDPARWIRSVNEWHDHMAERIREIGGDMPSPQDEMRIYQVLLGAIPVHVDRPDHPDIEPAVDRVKAYMQKATREAHLHTSWTDPVARYEDTCKTFVDTLFSRDEGNTIPAEMIALQSDLLQNAMLNHAGQTLLKITSPGIPDIYQGEWLAGFAQSLVDPDNRRRVGPEVYERMTAQIMEWESNPPELSTLHRQPDADGTPHMAGLTTLYVLWRSMQARRENSDLFIKGTYEPLTPSDDYKDDFVAFTRKNGDDVAITVSPRLLGEKATLVDRGTLGITQLFNSKANGEQPPAVAEIPVDLPVGTELLNRMDGKTYTVTENHHGETVLHLDEVFRNFPQVLLTGKISREPAALVAEPQPSHPEPV